MGFSTNGRKGNLISIIIDTTTLTFQYSSNTLSLSLLLSSVSHRRFEIVSDWTNISAARFTKSLRFAIAIRSRIRISLAMIAPTFVMIESILSLRQCYQSNLLSLGFADGLAIRFWKFVFFFMYFMRDYGIVGLFSISCYCQIRISRFFGFSSSRVTVIARILKKFMFLWKWVGGTGTFLDTLVGFLIWQNREF